MFRVPPWFFCFFSLLYKNAFFQKKNVSLQANNCVQTQMKRGLLALAAVCLMGLFSCSSNKKGDVILSRSFPTSSWERFDFIEDDIEIKKPTTYDLVLTATFDPSYSPDNLTVVFTIFDADGRPFRTKSYKFRLKDGYGAWKSELVDGYYHFTLPINSELTVNEPGTYRFQLENRMPITPLTGIHEIAILNK